MVNWWIFSDSFLITVLAYIVVSISLNLEAGFTGVPNFGKHLFVFLGAFAAQGIGVRIAAWLYQALSPEAARQALAEAGRLVPGAHWASIVEAAADTGANRIIVNNYLRPFVTENLVVEVALLAIVLGVTILLAMVFGLLASYAALRLREEYLAILLLSFSELMVMVIFYQTESLNGGNKGLWAITFTKNPIRFALAGSAVLAALAFLYAERLANSPMGRAMRAVRDDEIAASVFGRDIASIRLKAIIAASVLAALAGFFYTQNNASATAITFNRVVWTFLPWAMIILGGMANNMGAVVGTIVFLIGKRLFEYYQEPIGELLHIQAELVGSMLPNILIGVLILVILYVRPQGIIPEHISKTVEFNKLAGEVLGEESAEKDAKHPQET
jgi:branched-chain amino acid transport system permease protein